MKNSKKSLREMARKISASFYIDAIDALDLTSEAQHQKLKEVEKERKDITETLLKHVVDRTPEERYNLEYCTSDDLYIYGCPSSQFEGTHYWYYSPILEKSILEPIISEVPRRDRLRILDIGAGDGRLLKALREKFYLSGELLCGIDISKMARRRICETGATAICGNALSTKGMVRESDIVFLSYFVDRDEDQRGTFAEAVAIVKDGGRIVLEGLFPCKLLDSNGVSYGTANITRGNNALEDICLVVAEFKRLKMTLSKVIVGQRLVYSLDGPEVLPSYILVFDKK